MARINLLPWRAERRKQRQKEFGVMVALSALAAIALSFLIVSYYNSQISGQNLRNKYLQDRIAEVKKINEEIDVLEATKAKLLARKEAIEGLQANRSQMVHLFDSLVRTIPDGVILTSIKQDDKTLSLTGRSQSNSRVSTYMRNLEGSGWMTKPDLSIIEAKGEDKGLPYEFSLSVTLDNPNAPKDEDGDGIPDAPIEQPAMAAEGEAEAAPAADAAAEPAGAAESAEPAAEAPAEESAPAAEPEAAPAASEPATGAAS
ncbi:PilN domain-containing protein [Marilutibacter maris]|uniref:Fimbrial protein n=1 Tax=Marilutibacter maris TaxID=1605891 RepID=A0A2U9T9V7_9GAMM|nr:PilN domain-containing protein [Lysobacter maris]AWV08372.1 fimbrial protein [Lysobacter maris]